MNTELITSVNDMIQDWGYLVVFLGLLLENTIFLGLLVPGVLILLIGGYFSVAGGLSLDTLIIVATLGTVMGDNLSFWLGRRFGSKLMTTPDSVKQAVANKSWFILVFHHAPYMRLGLPAFMGMNRFPVANWLLLDGISAVLFVLTYSFIGYAGATTYEHLDNVTEFFNHISPYIHGVVLVLLGAWIISLLGIYPKSGNSDKKVNMLQRVENANWIWQMLGAFGLAVVTGLGFSMVKGF